MCNFGKFTLERRGTFKSISRKCTTNTCIQGWVIESTLGFVIMVSGHRRPGHATWSLLKA